MLIFEAYFFKFHLAVSEECAINLNTSVRNTEGEQEELFLCVLRHGVRVICLLHRVL